jgi:hypothetical protein
MRRLLCLAALGLPWTLSASEGAAYLKIPQGAASSALGSAMAGMQGVEALWYTPAALASQASLQLSLSRDAWLGETRNDYLAAALPWGPGGLGTWINYVGTQDVYRDDLGQDTGSFGVYDLSGGLAYGWKMGPLGLGLGAKYLQEHVESIGSSTWAADLGTQLDLGTPRARLGLAVQNLGPDLDYDPTLGAVKPPLTYRAGLALDKVGGFLTVLQELRVLPESGESSYLAGLEVQGRAASTILSGRIGYDTSASVIGGGLAGLTLGAGFILENLHVDVAIVPYGQLGDPYRMTLGWDFAGVPRLPAAVAAPVLQLSPSPTAVPSATPPPAPKQAAFTVELPEGAQAVGATQTFASAQAAWDAAEAAASRGDLAAAEAAYQAGASLEPQNPLAWGRLAKFEYGQGAKAPAITAFEKMLSLKPDPALSQWLQEYRHQP